MIQFSMPEESVMAVGDHLENTRLRILAGIREGMQQGMEQLATNVVERMGAAGIKQRTGQLAQTILKSPRIVATDDVVIGEVSMIGPGGQHSRNLGLWLEVGISVPELKIPNPKAKLYGFTAADGASVFTHGHAAFQIAGHPFFNPALADTLPTILDTINARIAEAVDGSV